MDARIEKLRRQLQENPGDKIVAANLRRAMFRAGITIKNYKEDNPFYYTYKGRKKRAATGEFRTYPSRALQRAWAHNAGRCSKNEKCRFCRRYGLSPK